MEAQTTRSRTTTIVVIVVVALLLLCSACFCLVLAGIALSPARSAVRSMQWRIGVGTDRVEATEQISRRLEVSAPFSLEIQAGVGDVRIEVGNEDQVQIRGTKHAWGSDRAEAEGRLRDFRVDISQPAPNRIVIEAQAPERGQTRSPRVDLVITVPRLTDVRAVVNVGTLWVAGLEGALDLTTNVGEMQVRDVVFTASSRLSTNVGELYLRLPSDAAFWLDAKTSVGQVSSDFALQEESTGGSLVGKSLRGRVGEAPTVTLTLRVNTGEIRIERGR